MSDISLLFDEDLFSCQTVNSIRLTHFCPVLLANPYTQTSPPFCCSTVTTSPGESEAKHSTPVTLIQMARWSNGAIFPALKRQCERGKGQLVHSGPVWEMLYLYIPKPKLRAVIRTTGYQIGIIRAPCQVWNTIGMTLQSLHQLHLLSFLPKNRKTTYQVFLSYDN